MSAGRTAEEEKAWIRQALQCYADDTGSIQDVPDPVPLGPAGNEFISSLYSVNARGPSGDVPLIVKTLPQDPVPSYSDVRHQFRNECLTYDSFLTLFFQTMKVDGECRDTYLESTQELFPKFFHMREDSTQCLLAIENLTPLGFTMAPKILDLTHMRLTLQALGRFHGLSYATKKREPEKFSNLAKRLYPWDEEMCRQFDFVVRGMTEHAVDVFRAAHPLEGEMYADRLKRMVISSDMLAKLTEPEEPLAVLCHGDFNRNNVMFKYGEDGQPLAVKFIDFQYATYSSPAIDLSLVLFLSTTPEVLGSNWDELFGIYHSNMLDTIENILCCSRDDLEAEYSMDVLMKDFKKFCLHGLGITTYFMPATLLEPEEYANFESDWPPFDSPDFVTYTKKICSTEAKRRLAALIKILIVQNVL